MGKFTLIVVVIYILYYSGNIIYDLFLKKEKIVNQEESQTFSVGDLAETDEEIASIEIEDVENINTPESFNKLALINEKISESPDIDDLRKKFEAEESIDFYNMSKEANIHLEAITNKKEEMQKVNFRELLNQAETQVQVVATHDGRKIYQVDK